MSLIDSIPNTINHDNVSTAATVVAQAKDAYDALNYKEKQLVTNYVELFVANTDVSVYSNTIDTSNPVPNPTNVGFLSYSFPTDRRSQVIFFKSICVVSPCIEVF